MASKGLVAWSHLARCSLHQSHSPKWTQEMIFLEKRKGREERQDCLNPDEVSEQDSNTGCCGQGRWWGEETATTEGQEGATTLHHLCFKPHDS